MTEEKKHYVLSCKCLNCGEAFDENIPFGTRVYEESNYLSEKCLKIGTPMIMADRVECPVCGTTYVQKAF